MFFSNRHEIQDRAGGESDLIRVVVSPGENLKVREGQVSQGYQPKSAHGDWLWSKVYKKGGEDMKMLGDMRW